MTRPRARRPSTGGQSERTCVLGQIAFCLLVAAFGLGGGASASARGAQVPADSILICANSGRWTPLIAPARCEAQQPRSGLAGLANLARIRWSRWGGPVATATARDLGTRAYDKPRAVTLRAYRRRSYCGTDDLAYTRLRITWRGASRTLRMPACAP